jgi:glutathione S-transferase
MRILWLAAELGLSYEHVPLQWDNPALKTPDFLKLNIAGTIPTIVDDGFALSESLAITLYLAKKYGAPPLYPSDAKTEAEVWRWTLWAQSAIEPWLQRDWHMAALREAMGAHVEARAQAALAVLNNALEGRTWLCGEAFSVGDLNVASILSPSRASQTDLGPWRAVRDWLARCAARPANIATRTRFGS